MDNAFAIIEDGMNRLYADLVFNLASGPAIEQNVAYDQQVEHFVKLIMPVQVPLDTFLEYGQKYRATSKYIFPNKPEQVKNRSLLIKYFSGFVVFDKLIHLDRYSPSSEEEMNIIIAALRTENDGLCESDKATFSREIMFLVKRYLSCLQESSYIDFISRFNLIADHFEVTYKTIREYVYSTTVNLTVPISGCLEKGAFSSVVAVYGIDASEQDKFKLEVDALAETVMIKNQCLEYEEEFIREWEDHFPKLAFCDELIEYVKSKKTAFVLSYGNKTSSRDERYLLKMLADVTVKLALADGARNIYELAEKTKELTRELSNTIVDSFIECRKNSVRVYHLAHKEDYPAEWRRVLIPYRTDLLYIRDIIVEEISFKGNHNIVQRQSRASKDASEYELLISQKDAEIFELQKELEYYETIKQQEFKAEVSQYNRALSDLFRRMCDKKYNSPLNELFLFANGFKEISPDSVKGILHNLFFVLSSMNITPYETTSIGKKVRFYDDEANSIYTVDENKTKEGLNQGLQIYPGWKFKDFVLSLPKVEIEEE